MDRQKAIKSVKDAYTVNGFTEPEIFLFDSPFNGLLELSRLQQSLEDISRGLNQKVQHQNKLFFAIPSQLDSKLDRQLKAKLYTPLVYLQQLGRLLEWQLQTVFLDTFSLIGTGFYNSISSDSLASNYCYYDFCISILNCEHNPVEWETSQALLQAGGWIFPFEKVCLICERHTKISFDDNNRLHAVGEPALVFADGFSVYAYRGALMPEKYSSVSSSQWQSEWYLEESGFHLRQALIEFLPHEQLQVNWLLEETNVGLS